MAVTMASQAPPVSHIPVSVVADPGYWPQEPSPDDSNLALHFSPGGSSTTNSTANGSSMSPAQTPNSDKSDKASENAQGPPRASVAVACVQCRSRHLKCDGGVRCSRCRADGVECSYIKSRRGWKGKRKNKAENGASATPVPGQESTALLQSSINAALPTTPLQLQSPGYSLNNSLTFVDALGGAPNGINALAPAPLNQFNLNGTQRSQTNQFGEHGPPSTMSSFYHYFYNSHPFCLPRPRLESLFKERRAPLLELAVQYVGSCYLPQVPTEMYREALNRMLSNQNYPRDGYSVQALMLYGITLHANNEMQRSSQVFQMAMALTIELGMQRADFSLLHGNNDRVLEESWRRTWWGMYTANGMMAAVNPGVQFRLKDIATDVPLPCDNDQYFSGQIPFSHTLQEYDDAAFAPEELVFSSYTYLIDAIRILGKVFEVARLDSTFEYHVVDVVDAYLVNWRLHLPASKMEIIDSDGHVDELLFQAHMVNAGSTIMLHRPRSNLGFGRVENVNICVQPGQVLLPTQTREIHTAKCLTSAENISSLIKLPCSLLNHTPFFTCVCVMASVVHLSYWSFLVPDGQDDVIKQSIRLDVGVLQQYSNTWPVAHVVLGQVRGVAHTLFNSKKAMSIHLWGALAQDDVIRGVIEEGGNVPVEQYQQLLTPMLKS